MTTILNLSEEVLLIIFDLLEREDLQHCQHVCRSLYSPAHTKWLSEISLRGSLGIKKFIAAIDYNPDKTYLNAVKRIQVYRLDKDNCQLDQNTVEKLFFRFKNIEWISVDIDSASLFNDFNDCEGLIKACPKLDEFMIQICMFDRKNGAKYFEVTSKLRQLITGLDLKDGELLDQYGGAGKFISGFPRLKGFMTSYNVILNFREILPAFEHLPNLTIIKMQSDEDDENFAEKYLSTRPKHIQDLVVQRLSKIGWVAMENLSGFPANSIKFIDKYMTGLDTFVLDGVYIYDDLTELEQRTTHDSLMDIICSTKKKARASLMDMNSSDISTLFPMIAHKLFRQDTTTSTQRILKLKLDEDLDYPEMANISILRDSFERKIEIAMPTKVSIHDFSSHILDQTTTIEGVDEFILEIEKRDSKKNNTRVVTTNTYDAILDKFSSMKKVTLTVPLSYEERDSTSTSVFPMVEDLIIRSIPDVCIQKLLDRCSSAFPSMKRLTLHHFTGVWNEDVGEYRVDLSSCNLEKLEVDVTPITNKTFKCMQEKFFVIVVDTGKHHSYKVPIALSTISSVEENDLDGLTLGRDYVQLFITVAGLTRLEVCGIVYPEDDQYYYYNQEPDEDDDYYLDISYNFKKCGITLDINEKLLR